jgi:hypothetical protein
MKFFHFAPMTLGAGSIIEPGNFGRVITTTQPAFQSGDTSIVQGYVARELAFELVRERSFAAKPSRLRAAFGCPTQADAQAYANFTNLDKRQVLHEVETVNDAAPLHIGALSYCDITTLVPFIDTTLHRAQLYWSGLEGDPARGREIIVESAIRVIGHP